MAPHRKHLRRRLEKAVFVYIKVWDAVKRMRRRTRMTLTQPESEYVKETYNQNPMFDTNQDVLQFLRKLGQNISDSDLHELFESNGFVPGSTPMTLERMVRLVETLKRRHHESIVPDTVEAFAALGGEKNKKGTVDVMILKRAVEAFDLTIDIDKMIQEVDEDQSGHVDFEEFSKMFATEGENLRRLQHACASEKATPRTAARSPIWPRRQLRHSIPSFSQLLPDRADCTDGSAKGRRSKHGLPGQSRLVDLDGVGHVHEHGHEHGHTHSVRGNGSRKGGSVTKGGPIDVGQDIAQLRERLLMSGKTELPPPARKDLQDPPRGELATAGHQSSRKGRLAGLGGSNEPSTHSLRGVAPVDPWLKSGQTRGSRNVTFIGSNRAPPVGVVGLDRHAAAARGGAAASPRARPRSPLSPTGRQVSPKPDPIAFAKTHSVLSKMGGPNRLCPSTLTSSKVVSDAAPDRMKLQAVERWGKKAKPRGEPQQLIAKDARYLDYLASTPSFTCPTEVEEVKRRYKAFSTQAAAMSSRGMSQHGAQTLSALAQIALQGISRENSLTSPPLPYTPTGAHEATGWTPPPQAQPQPQAPQPSAAKYMSLEMQDPLVHEAERLTQRSASGMPAVQLLHQQSPYRHISHPHHQN